MSNEEIKFADTETTSSALTTDDVPQGFNNLYLSTDGGSTDELGNMPNFNLVQGTLNAHLVNPNNPHSNILSGLRTHQTQITLTQDIILDNTQYVDCLLVQASNTADRVITIPDETTIGFQFATNAAFEAFRMGTANLTIKLATGVTFTNVAGNTISLPDPQTSYFLFIRQNLNQWAVVTYAAAGTTTLEQAYGNGDGTITLISGKPFILNGSGGNQVAIFDLNNGISFNANTAYSVATINANGQQTHPPQTFINGVAKVDSTNIDSVFINSTNPCSVGIQTEPATFYAPNATFDVWALNSGALSVIAASGVTIIGSPSIVNIPPSGYYSFRRQSTNTWAFIAEGAQIATLQSAYDNSSPKQITFASNQGLAFSGDSSTGALVNFSGLYQLSINIASEYNSALFQIDSTTQGWMGPRMTQVQRDAINVSQNPTGLEIYNTTANTKDYWDTLGWQQLLTISHLLAGTGISITNNGNGTVTVNSTAASSVNTTIISSSTIMTADAAINIFVMQNTTVVTLTLPAAFTAGQVFKIIGGDNTASFSIALNAGQSVQVINQGVAASATTSLNIDTLTDSLELVANLDNLQLTLTSSNSPDITFN